MKILVSGSLAYDKIMNFPGYFKDHILPDKIHNLNVSFTIEKLTENFGGTAGNIAYNLALLDEDPIIISSAGNDFGKYKKWLEQTGVDVSKIKTVTDDSTAFANIMTDQADNQLSAFYPGAMNNLCDINDIKAYLAKESGKIMAIISPGYAKEMVSLAEFYRKHKIPFVFDPGQQITVLSPDDLRNSIKGAKMFISNDYELSMVMKKTGWSENEILGEVEILITTLGEQGSKIRTQKECFDIKPAKPKNTSDPTGAGDAYRAGFIKGLIEGWSLDVAGRFAGTVSCYAVENYGTQMHSFNLEKVKQRYQDNFGDGPF